MNPSFSLLATVWLSLCVLAVLVICLTRFDIGRSRAVFRLDWFLPALRRRPQNLSVSNSLLGRWLRIVVPRSWQSNRATKRRGLVRRGLRRLGTSWLASPVRRVVQSLCLVTFCTLFFYVCWPYDAAPGPQVVGQNSWILSRIDQQSGQIVVFHEKTSERSPDGFLSGPQSAQSVFLYETDSREVNAPNNKHTLGRLGEFRIEFHNENELWLSWMGDLREAPLDRLLTSTGGFTLYLEDPAAWPSHYAMNLSRKEVVPAEFFLVIDPLVSLSTAIASRSWVGSLISALVILSVCVLIPRGFCGYLCPLGTTIDLFDWGVSSRITRFRVAGNGWWVHIKYYLLLGTLIAAVGGVLVSGFFSAIPVITRAMLFLVDPWQSAVARGHHLVPEFHWGQGLSIAMFLMVLGLGLLQPRFWCKYVCPSGAIFSLGNIFRLSERKVESSCIHCNKCVEVCPFDAIKADFTTRTTDCTLCQTCAGVCPTEAIKFVERWNRVELKVLNEPETQETSLGRRGFLTLATGSTAATLGGLGFVGITKVWGANLDSPEAFRAVRPPGSVPEREFLEMCIRCGECFKVCPNNVLQPEGFQQGLEGLWAPLVNADWAGCESSCNACGQVCPTGAIRPLPLIEKKSARMGLAVVNLETCLPHARREECDLCVQECNAAGYHAIEYAQVGTVVDQQGQPIEGTGFLAPVVRSDLCVGCGLCQTRCYTINVKSKHLLQQSAIIIEAGEGKEDRLMQGSYIALREEEERQRLQLESREGGYFIPDLSPTTPESDPLPPLMPSDNKIDDPFGLDESPF